MFPACSNHTTHFRLWAPFAQQVGLQLLGPSAVQVYSMERVSDGYHTLTLDCGHGQLYQYVINGRTVPDPASAFQPEGVHGPSMVVDFSQFKWSDQDWTGVALADLIFYEIHIGTFTQAGTYSAAIRQLDELVNLGVSAIALMPLAQCPGRWNWGYDGVDVYAPNHMYGDPASLATFVDACHQRGLAVVLDVVYNHVGPEGNYLQLLGPYFGDRSTPWGHAFELSGSAQQPVRSFFLQNAVYWVEHYHFDGLRFDAVGAIHDEEAVHLINEIGCALRERAAVLGRHVHAIGEANLHRPEFLPAQGGTLDAIWVDDVAHALGSCLDLPAVCKSRCYAGLSDLVQALRLGYVFAVKQDEIFKLSPADCPPFLEAHVHYLQNHDLVGNRPQGKRIHQWTSPVVQRALIPLVLLHPSIPLLFMGEEYAADSPFLFFTDFGQEELSLSVERGRADEFKHSGFAETVSPTCPKAFRLSKVSSLQDGDWTTYEWYKKLIKIRKFWRSEGFLYGEHLRVEHQDSVITLTYKMGKNLRYVATDIFGHRPTVFDSVTASEMNCGFG